MSTRSIDIMLSVPGIYVITSRNQTAFAEVDAEGVCFQLELASGTYARDGEMRPGNWITANIVSIDGPFARAPAKRNVTEKGLPTLFPGGPAPAIAPAADNSRCKFAGGGARCVSHCGDPICCGSPPPAAGD